MFGKKKDRRLVILNKLSRKGKLESPYGFLYDYYTIAVHGNGHYDYFLYTEYKENTDTAMTALCSLLPKDLSENLVCARKTYVKMCEDGESDPSGSMIDGLIDDLTERDFFAMERNGEIEKILFAYADELKERCLI